MTAITSKYRTTKEAIIKIAPEKGYDPSDTSVCVTVDLPLTSENKRAWIVLEQQEAYEAIVALAKEAGILTAVGHYGGLTIVKPTPKKTKAQIRREELQNVSHTKLLDTIIDLELAAGKL